MEGAIGLATGIPARLTSAQGRKFGLTVGGAFLVLAAVLWWRDRLMARNILAGLGLLLSFAGLTVPTLLGPVERAWMGLAHLISKVTTPVFMGLVYFVILAPIGVLMRLIGRDPLAPSKGPTGFWVARDGQARGDMTRQF